MMAAMVEVKDDVPLFQLHKNAIQELMKAKADSGDVKILSLVWVLAIRLTGQTVVTSPENPIPLTPADWTGEELPLPLTWDAMILKVVALFTQIKLALQHRHRHRYPHMVVELIRLTTRLLKISPNQAKDLIPNPNLDLSTDPIHIASQQLIDSASRLAVDLMESAGSWSPLTSNDFSQISLNYAISCAKNYIGHLQSNAKIINDPNQLNLLHPNIVKGSELGPLTDFKLTLRVEILSERIGQGWGTLERLIEAHFYKFPNPASMPPRCPKDTFHKKIEEISIGFLPSLQSYLNSVGNLVSLLSWVQMKEVLSLHFLNSSDFPHPILAQLMITQNHLQSWLSQIIDNLVISVNMTVTGMYPFDISFWKTGYDLTRDIHKLCIQFSQSQPTLGYLATSSLLSHSPKQIGSRQIMSIMRQPNVNLQNEWKRASHLMLKKMTSQECPILSLKSRLFSLFKTRGVTQNSRLDEIEFPTKPLDPNLSDYTNDTDYDSSVPSSPNDPNFYGGSNNVQAKLTLAPKKEHKKLHSRSKSKVSQVQYHSSSGKVRLATWTALIEMLTPDNKASDSKFMRIFFLSFRYFATPEELFYALREQFEGSEFEGRSTPKDIRVYNALKCWLEMYYFPEDYAVIPLVRQFAASYLSKMLPSGAARLTELAQTLINSDSTRPPNTPISNPKYLCISRFNEQNSHIDALSNMSIMSTHSPLGNATLTPEHPLQDWDPWQLAQVLTAIDSELFRSIRPQDLMRSTEEGHSHSVKKMSDWNNQVTTWVIETILAEQDIRKRSLILKSFVRVAEKLYSLSNFNSLMAVLSGLNSSAISRLNSTWCMVSTQFRTIFDHLNQTFDPKKNFVIYRTKLRDTPPPCIPFFGIYLTDLTFIHQGNPTYKTVALGSPDAKHGLDMSQIEVPPPNPPHHRGTHSTHIPLEQPEQLPTGPSVEYINFDKFTRLVKVVDDIERFQIPYNLPSDCLDELCDVLRIQIKAFDPLKTHSKVQPTTKKGGITDHSKDHYHRSLMLEPRDKSVNNVTLMSTIEVDESSVNDPDYTKSTIIF